MKRSYRVTVTVDGKERTYNVWADSADVALMSEVYAWSDSAFVFEPACIVHGRSTMPIVRQ